MSKWQEYFYEDVVEDVEGNVAFSAGDLDLDMSNSQIGNVLGRAARTFASDYVERLESEPREGTRYIITDMERALEDAESFDPEENRDTEGVSMEELVDHALTQVTREAVGENEIVSEVTSYLQEHSPLKDPSSRIEKAAQVADRLEEHPEIEYDEIRKTYTKA